MYNYQAAFDTHISMIKSEGRYRNFVEIQRIAGKFPYAYHIPTESEVILWCINDYLGMGQNPYVLDAGNKALQLMGAGAGGTRNIGGNTTTIVQLENLLAKLHNKEKGLVFTSGYVANETTLSTIAKIIPDVVYFSDEDNHASIIHGIKNSRAEKCIYNHLDIESLHEQLKKYSKDRPKVIVFESIYSMDGLESPIDEICKLAKEYNALTYIDEVHTVGLYGENGSGIAKLRGLDGKIDIIQGTLGKAYGVIGGYITGSAKLIEAIRLSAPGFIFTTALPPVVTASAFASVTHLMNSNLEREQHQQKIAQLKEKLDNNGIGYINNKSHIIPIVIGDPNVTKAISEKLLTESKIFVQHINYPTVARGTERLRITPTPCHTEEMMDHLVDSLIRIFNELNIKRKDMVAA